MSREILRCALLGSFVIDPLPPLIQDRLRGQGVATEWWVCAPGQFPQAILDLASPLYRFAPRIVFCAAAEDLFPHRPEAEPPRADESWSSLEEYLALIAALTERLPEVIVAVHRLYRSRASAAPLLEPKDPGSLPALIDRANVALNDLAAANPRVFILDPGGAPEGEALFDPRFYYLARLRLGRAGMNALARIYSRFIGAALGIRRKVIAVDLDDTLWGGILGEQGLTGLVLDGDGPGRAFQDLQRVLLDHHGRGVLLSLCSKNDESLALEALDRHPGMLLRSRCFAAWRINWRDKASNLRELSEELGCGLDSFVFLDDSPHERELVRHQLPMVEVPELPGDLALRPDFIAALPWFDTLQVTDEDRRRGDLYRAESERNRLRSRATSLSEFLAGLKVRVTVRRAEELLLPRVAQLTQRTNQLNLTARRYSLSDLRRRLGDPHWRMYTAACADRIGDAGIVGAALVEITPSGFARLDTFLLSCRVIGRGIESAFLAGIAADLASSGLAWIEAEYIPTERNSICAGFLRDHGFLSTPEGRCGKVGDLVGCCPPWIHLATALPERRIDRA